METVSSAQARQFRLYAHHLNDWRCNDSSVAASACGFQNSPPGAWETALFNRVFACVQHEMKQRLEEDKTLLQAWSLRGAPVVFPTAESDVFLKALVAEPNEPWIYTKGIQLALDFLQMPFDALLPLLEQVIGKLEQEVIKSKTMLDQTLATWMMPLLAEDKRDLWNRPSMYGSPQTQTVGGAVVSFLLRPCAFLGYVVFGAREGASPSFTAYKRWTGHPLFATENAVQNLVRKYLHCYGPACVSGFRDWLGCSPAQAKRMWQTVAEEIEPVNLCGKERYILTQDKAMLLAPPPLQRPLHLLGGHDPYLGLQDREIILENKACQRQIWQTVSNPGVVLWQGKIVGWWKGVKQGEKLEINILLWEDDKIPKKQIEDLCASYALFRQLALHKITLQPFDMKP